MKQEIFDKDGNKLELVDLIYGFMKAEAEKLNKDIEDIYMGVDRGLKNNYLEIIELCDNGYDAVYPNDLKDIVVGDSK